MLDRRERLRRASLYLVCGAQPDEFLHAALRGGVDIVQLRDKHAGEAELLRTAERFRELTTAHDALLIVNDHPELAVAAHADGVHVGQDDMPVVQARGIVGPDRLVGRSTHTPAQIDAARGVDYIGVGPVHATPTKPGRPAVGLELVRYAAAHARVPFFAIGGIDADNVRLVRDAGASRIAVVRALTQAGDPEAVAEALQGAGVGAA
ncbi:MAG TPA: thiamine phosphate synthase [Solirubrobacteraceae bacterium]|nr:thiamine phosphate synthase [Solirubrobacteraceae bacterium]